MIKAKVDKNQAKIVRRLREANAWVKDLHRVGQDFPDILVAYFGNLYLMEIKSEGGKRTPGQVEFAFILQAYGVPVYVVQTPEEALRIIRGINNG